MIRLKTAGEIKVMAQGGKVLADILDKLTDGAKEGVTSRQLDEQARWLAREAGARPSFLGYAPSGRKPYPAAACVSVNTVVVHGLPGDILLAEGDVVGIDMGIEYKGLYLDSARTVGIGKVSRQADKLMRITRRALAIAIGKCWLGNTVGDIGAAVQSYVEKNGFEVVRALVGHGVGYDVHEEPAVPNFGEAGAGLKLKEGLVIAIEPMVTVGDSEVVISSDGWTVETKKGGLAAHEEHTVAITSSGPLVLTKSEVQSSYVK